MLDDVILYVKVRYSYITLRVKIDEELEAWQDACYSYLTYLSRDLADVTEKSTTKSVGPHSTPHSLGAQLRPCGLSEVAAIDSQ